MKERKEKRRFPRVPVNFVTVEVFSPTGDPESAELCFIINLSENGMMFRGQRDYQPRQPVVLTFTLPLPNGEDMIIRADAVIIHVQMLQTSKFFGTQFRNLGLAEHRCLREYVRNALKGEEEKPGA